MINKIITAQYQRLDFESHNAVFPKVAEKLSVAWIKKLSSPSDRTWLRWDDDKLLLVCAPHSISVITNNGLSVTEPVDEPFFQLYRGYESNPVVVAEDGNLFRLTQDLRLISFTKTHSSPTAIIPVGFPDEHILLSLKKNSFSKLIPWTKPWVTQFVNGHGQKIKWSDNQFLQSCLPGSEGIFLNYGLGSPHIRYIDVSGQLTWQTKMDAPVSEIIGQVNNKVWVRTAGGKIAGIQIDNGIIEHLLSIPGAKNPLCTIDEKGRIIICNGINLIVVDTLSGTIIFFKTIKIRKGESSSTAHGNEVVITADDHVIYADYNNKIFSTSLLNVEPSTFLWQAPERVKGHAIYNDQLIVLTGSSLTGLENKI